MLTRSADDSKYTKLMTTPRMKMDNRVHGTAELTSSFFFMTHWHAVLDASGPLWHSGTSQASHHATSPLLYQSCLLFLTVNHSTLGHSTHGRCRHT